MKVDFSWNSLFLHTSLLVENSKDFLTEIFQFSPETCLESGVVFQKYFAN